MTVTPEVTPPEVTIRTEVTGAYKGQINGDVVATDKTGKQVGLLQYQQFEDEVLIAWMEVSPEMQRRGVATQLYQELQKEWPDKKITWGMTTPEGTALRKKIEGELPEAPVTPEVLADYPDLQKAKLAVSTSERIIELDRKHTLPELQSLCRQKGLSTSGDKKTLVRRLF